MEGKSHVSKDSRQRFTVQKSVYTTKQSPRRVSNERRGDTLQVPTVRLVVCPQEPTSLMCIPVSEQATLGPTGDREHAQRVGNEILPLTPGKGETAEKTMFPLYRGWPRWEPPPETQLHAHLMHLPRAVPWEWPLGPYLPWGSHLSSLGLGCLHCCCCLLLLLDQLGSYLQGESRTQCKHPYLSREWHFCFSCIDCAH